MQNCKSFLLVHDYITSKIVFKYYFFPEKGFTFLPLLDILRARTQRIRKAVPWVTKSKSAKELGEFMGHQESLLFCDSKKDMIRLCKLLNKAAADPSERGLEYAELDIYEVARLKRDINTWLPGRDSGPIYPKGSYFIWWGGERAPQTEDEFLLTRFTGLYPYWETIFAEYIIPDARELLTGMKETRSEGLQENDWIRTFHPGEGNQISLELIEQL